MEPKAFLKLLLVALIASSLFFSSFASRSLKSTRENTFTGHQLVEAKNGGQEEVAIREDYGPPKANNPPSHPPSRRESVDSKMAVKNGGEEEVEIREDYGPPKANNPPSHPPSRRESVDSKMTVKNGGEEEIEIREDYGPPGPNNPPSDPGHPPAGRA